MTENIFQPLPVESAYDPMPVWILTPDIGAVGQLGSCFVIVPQLSSTARLETACHIERIRWRVDRTCLRHLIRLEPRFQHDGRYRATPYWSAAGPVVSISLPPGLIVSLSVRDNGREQLRISRQ